MPQLSRHARLFVVGSAALLGVLCEGAPCAAQGKTQELSAAERKLPEAVKFPFDSAAATRYQRDYAAYRRLPLEIQNKLGLKFVLIPPGTFTMGSPPDEPGRKGDERAHTVTLTRPFYLGQHEVTVGQFRAFVKETSHVTDVEKNGGGHAHDAKAVWEHRAGTHWLKPGYAGPHELRDDHPVVHVSHADARAYCAWLTKTKSKVDKLPFEVRYELPSEGQWEWACRAGSAARFWWGEDDDTSGKVANVGDVRLKRVHPDWPRAVMAMDDGHAFIAPVGSYRANPFGLYDMLGNVWEFCRTRHGDYLPEAATDPGDLSQVESYSVRGGGWSNVAEDCRSATRNSDPPHFGHSNLGFRIAIPVVERGVLR